MAVFYKRFIAPFMNKLFWDSSYHIIFYILKHHGSLSWVLLVIHHKLPLTLILQSGVERHLPKLYTFREKITDRGLQAIFIT